MAINLMVDLIYAFLDPRVHWRTSKMLSRLLSSCMKSYGARRQGTPNMDALQVSLPGAPFEVAVTL